MVTIEFNNIFNYSEKSLSVATDAPPSFTLFYQVCSGSEKLNYLH